MKIIECQQYDPLWWKLHRTMATSSSFDKIITAKTEKMSAQVDKLCYEIIAAKMTPDRVPEGGYMSKAMMHGLECEPEARRWYEFAAEVDVSQVGFVMTDDERFGCSPDGMIGDEGSLELKCPEPHTHVAYLHDGGLPADYRAQVHGQILVAERKWVDFVSYCPGLPPLRVRVEPNGFTEALRTALDQFWKRLVEIEKRIAEMQP